MLELSGMTTVEDFFKKAQCMTNDNAITNIDSITMNAAATVQPHTGVYAADSKTTCCIAISDVICLSLQMMKASW